MTPLELFALFAGVLLVAIIVGIPVAAWFTEWDGGVR